MYEFGLSALGSGKEGVNGEIDLERGHNSTWGNGHAERREWLMGSGQPVQGKWSQCSASACPPFEIFSLQPISAGSFECFA